MEGEELNMEQSERASCAPGCSHGGAMPEPPACTGAAPLQPTSEPLAELEQGHGVKEVSPSREA